METTGKSKFMRRLSQHEDKINEVLLEVMTTTSEEDDLWDDEEDVNDELLNEPDQPTMEDDNNKIFDQGTCNIAIAEPMKGLNYMEWIDV